MGLLRLEYRSSLSYLFLTTSAPQILLTSHPICPHQLTLHNSIAGVGTFKPELIMKSLISVIMAGIIAVYGLVIAVLIAGDMSPEKEYTLFAGIMHLAAGLSVGLAGAAAGYAIGTVGNAGARAFLQQPKVFVGKVLILIFAEVLGLYGLIVALILNTRKA
ncbi:V-ATPase proteolipid subunit C-like domain-containing protein [Terfezia claveryi]|nr:V-ATPase proteolipid subunit C-like domain-containing protein [Terfezia claveryi]